MIFIQMKFVRRCLLGAMFGLAGSGQLLAQQQSLSPVPLRDAEQLSLSLPQAIALAVARNYDLKIAGSAVQSSVAAERIAAAAPNPMVTLQTTGVNPKNGIGAGNLRSKSIDSALRVDQLVERGGKRELRQESAAHLRDAARADFHDTQRQLGIAVSQAYYELLAAQEKREILKQSASLYGNTINAARQRQKAGDLAGADLARLQVDALRSSNEALLSETDVLKASQALSLLLGQAAGAPRIRLADSWPAAIVSSNAVATVAMPPEEIIAHRADVVAAAARLDAAIATRQLALASRSRDVALGVQYEHYPVTASNGQGSGNSLGFFVQVPLFVRSYFEGEIGVAEAAIDSARATLAKTREQAAAELWQNQQELAAYVELIQRYDNSLLVAAKKSADAAEFAFRHGAIGIMDVLDTRRTYQAIELDALSARSAYAKSLSAWQVNWQANLYPDLQANLQTNLHQAQFP